LGPGQTQILIPSSFDISDFILRVGEPLNSIFVVKQNGELTQADISNKVALFGTETVGDPKYEDFNGDGVIDANDRQIVGHPNPDYIWGITNTFRFKGFDVSVLVKMGAPFIRCWVGHLHVPARVLQIMPLHFMLTGGNRLITPEMVELARRILTLEG
jgi:hypothetical protein